MGKRENYGEGDMRAAVAECAKGMKLSKVCDMYPDLPSRTIRRRGINAKQGVEQKRPGPPPVLPVEFESDLVDWVVAMQASRLPVSRDMVLNKANEVYRTLYGSTRSTGFLGRGWLKRFMGRHPQLSLRIPRVISQARNQVEVPGLTVLHNELIKHCVKRKLTSDRMFYMDESGFGQSSKSKKVVAVSGSKDVWTKVAGMSFHLTLVACVSAVGDCVPPLYIVPGMRVNRDVLDACTIPGSTVVTAPKGFMNGRIFERWLVHFAASVPDTVRRPLVLVYDGCSSHFSSDITTKAIELKIILVVLPPNATHLMQPLDVAVFKPLKTAITRKLERFLIDTQAPLLSKKEAIGLTSEAWQERVVARPATIVSAFETTGIWPISLPKMLRRLQAYKDGGVNMGMVDAAVAPWLKVREQVRTEIFPLPSPGKWGGRRRKTIDLSDRLLTREQLDRLDS